MASSARRERLPQLETEPRERTDHIYVKGIE